jgi:hypothetical protein
MTCPSCGSDVVPVADWPGLYRCTNGGGVYSDAELGEQ